MKAVIQRVVRASVSVEDEVISSIGKGLCVLIGISRDDTKKDMEYIARKVLSLRLFEDDTGRKWSVGVKDRRLEVLCVSQFTLYSVLKGNKLDFHNAMSADTSQQFYDEFMALLRSNYEPDLVKGADLPDVHTLRTTYLQSFRTEEEEKVKHAVKDQQVVILCDETANRKGEYVFVVLFKVLLASENCKLLVAGVKVLNSANSAECSRAVVETLTKYDVHYDNICGFVSDSVKYMNKCAELLKVLVCDNMLNIQCWAHKLNLIGNVWSTELTLLNECVVKTKMAFLNTRKRKHRYLNFLRKSSVEPKLFPSPVLTCWNSWFTSVSYLDEDLVHIIEFFRQQDYESGDAVEYFRELSNDDIVVLQCEAKFVVEYCKNTVDLLQCLEGSSYPFTLKLCAKLSDLKTGFKLVNDRNFAGQTAKLLNSGACLKAATGVKLAATDQKCFFKMVFFDGCGSWKVVLREHWLPVQSNNFEGSRN